MTSPLLADLGTALRGGAATAARLVDEAFARIDDPRGQGRVAFISVDREGARRAADASDARRRAGRPISPLDGVPVSIKDLFDVAGQTTTAGSRVLAGAPPAARDAAAVARLRAAGAILMGRTNMTEFAFSGIGLNPHYGTPLAAYDRATGRIAGGSSSGAAVSVAEGMAHAALGTDTGGSIRIPAAFCGLVGFKPTASRVPREGAYPLSTSLDSIGPIARSVACCAAIDAVLAGETPVTRALPLQGLRLAVPDGVLLDRLDGEVAAAFEAALHNLSRQGANIVHAASAAISGAARSGVQGIVASAEAWALHRDGFAERADAYDPRVAVRVRAGLGIPGAEYVEAVRLRAALAQRWAHECEGIDAVLAPTVACVPPPLAALERSDREYDRADLRALRGTSIVNALDGCALSIPCHREGEPPVGLTVAAPAGRDRGVLAAGMAIEAALA